MDEQAAAYLRDALEREAAKCVTSYFGLKDLTLKRMKRHLCRMYRVEGNSDMHRLQLVQMQRKSGQTLRFLACQVQTKV